MDRTFTILRTTSRQPLAFAVWPSVVILLLASTRVLAETEEQRMVRLGNQIRWQQGPCTVDVGNVAEFTVPSGFQFTDAEGARIFAQVTQNQPDDQCLGVLVPSGGEWFVAFEFSDIGHVKDDEKNSLDASAILAGIKSATARANDYRRLQGWSELHVIGWEQSPAYAADTNQLIWAIRGRSSDGEVINYNTRMLGRGGVMSVNLVDSPESFSGVVPVLKGILTGFHFKAGHRYGEWRAGDKVAAIGLSGVIVGGGTAIAAKTGLLAKLWKPIVAAVAALIAWLKGGRVLRALQGKK